MVGAVVLISVLGLAISFAKYFNDAASKPRLPPPYLAKSLADIHDSRILFNPPKEMEQGKKERIEARISYHDIGDAITKGLRGRGEPQLELIQVGERMTVTLHGDEEEFEISKYSSEEQLVAGRSYAQWEWDVTPLQYGELSLHLKAVINVIDSKKQETAYDIPVIDRVINVKVNPPYIAARAARDKQIWTIVFGSGIGVVVVSTIVTAIIGVRRKRRETVVRGFGLSNKK